MSIDTTNIPEQIIALKRRIHEQCPNITEHFRELETILAEEIDSIEPPANAVNPLFLK